MCHDVVHLMDAVAAVTVIEMSMQGAALLGSMSPLHSAFPEDADTEVDPSGHNALPPSFRFLLSNLRSMHIKSAWCWRGWVCRTCKTPLMHRPQEIQALLHHRNRGLRTLRPHKRVQSCRIWASYHATNAIFPQQLAQLVTRV
eukprot:m.115771 g.115771  ORF g.115771 m.115771 type:complete len:143 (+) comp51922_c0_seq12:1862-2290(+)